MFKNLSITDILVVILITIILLQRCGGGKIDVPKNTHDTTISVHYVYLKDTGNTTSTLIYHHRDTILEKIPYYLPSANYDTLKNQFLGLKELFLGKNVFQTIIPIDTIGNVQITDTIQRNSIIGSHYISSLKIPIKTIIINNTIYSSPRNQFYIGGGLEGTTFYPIKQFSVGLLLKNKRDQIYGISGGIDLESKSYVIGLNSYWKIKFK
jgi:hypothetical protein